MRPTFREQGKPTRSSWMFLGNAGGPCDLACKHCFYHYSEDLVFFDFESLCFKANKFRHYYGLEATDITGGEPSIYTDPKLKERGLVSRMEDGRNQHLEALVEHCANIGLAPSIITHGANSTESFTKAIEDLGLDTWKYSLHGLGRLGDKELGVGHKLLVVGHGDREVEDHFERMVQNSRHCTRPIRWNCSVTGHTYQELGAWAKFLVDNYPPTVADMQQYMIYDSQADKQHDWIKTYTECGPHIAEAVETLEAAGFEVNVRYFPFCVGEKFGFAKNCQKNAQIQYDWAEWCALASGNVPLERPYGDVRRGAVTEEVFWDEVEKLRLQASQNYALERQPHCPPCQECAARRICDGPERSYSKWFGTDEFIPFENTALGIPKGDVIHDPNYFLLREAPEKQMVSV